MDLKKLFLLSIFVPIIFAFTLFPVQSANGQTFQELEARLRLALETLGKIQSQLRSSAITASPTQVFTGIPNGFQFSRNLQSGSTGDDVRYLQIILNSESPMKVTEPGRETNYFGPRTRASVIAFQNKFFSEILAPAGLSSGTGTVGPATRKKLNSFISKLSTKEVGGSLDSAVPESATTTVEIIPVQQTTLPASFSFSDINSKTRSSLVNILCTSKRGEMYDVISGSGIFVDPRGVILTNAHVAQYFLLEDFPTPGFVDCVIRSGEPAVPMYDAIPLYISPQWIVKNKKGLVEERPKGTGENDFAFLLVNKSINVSRPLPSSFPHVEMDFTDTVLRQGLPFLAAGYPAGFLSGIIIQKDLYPVSTIATTSELYSFESESADLFTIEGSLLAQHGSSGGAIVGYLGKLIGLIATASGEATTGDRELNAITPLHMEDSFREHNNFSIQNLFASDVRATAEQFNRDVAPDLKKLLADVLNGN